MKPHQNLESWKQSFSLVKRVYTVTSNFPSEEKFGLTSQIRRAVVSIPVNIAEGAARNTDKEFVQFLYIALGSASELETLLLLSSELQFLQSQEADLLLKDLETIHKLLLGLINKVKRDINSGK